jgi:hypothetical protein
MKVLLNLMAVAAFALPANLVFAEHHKEHTGDQSVHAGNCCDQKDCCKDCDHKDGKHSCCEGKDKAKDCCKDCDSPKCKKACKSGHCKKGHCDLKKPGGKKAEPKTET